VFLTEEDKKAAEELYQNFPTFHINVGMDRNDFAEGRINDRQWKVNAPAKNRIWCTGTGLTFMEAYKSLLKRLEEYDGL